MFIRWWSIVYKQVWKYFWFISVIYLNHHCQTILAPSNCCKASIPTCLLTFPDCIWPPVKGEHCYYPKWVIHKLMDLWSGLSYRFWGLSIEIGDILQGPPQMRVNDLFLLNWIIMDMLRLFIFQFVLSHTWVI